MNPQELHGFVQALDLNVPLLASFEGETSLTPEKAVRHFLHRRFTEPDFAEDTVATLVARKMGKGVECGTLGNFHLDSCCVPEIRRIVEDMHQPGDRVLLIGQYVTGAAIPTDDIFEVAGMFVEAAQRLGNIDVDYIVYNEYQFFSNRIWLAQVLGNRFKSVQTKMEFL